LRFHHFFTNVHCLLIPYVCIIYDALREIKNLIQDLVLSGAAVDSRFIIADATGIVWHKNILLLKNKWGRYWNCRGISFRFPFVLTVYLVHHLSREKLKVKRFNLCNTTCRHVIKPTRYLISNFSIDHHFHLLLFGKKYSKFGLTDRKFFAYFRPSKK
jgi:hypothetical protein